MNIWPPINTLCSTHSSFKAVWANFGQGASQVVSTGLLRSFVAPSSIYWSLFSAIIYAYWPRCGLLVSPTWFLKVYQFKVSFLGGAPSTKRGGCCDFMSSPFSTALTGQSKEFMGGMDLQPLMNTTRGTERGEICIWNLIEDQRLLQIIQPQVNQILAVWRPASEQEWRKFLASSQPSRVVGDNQMGRRWLWLWDEWLVSSLSLFLHLGDWQSVEGSECQSAPPGRRIQWVSSNQAVSTPSLSGFIFDARIPSAAARYALCHQHFRLAGQNSSGKLSNLGYEETPLPLCNIVINWEGPPPPPSNIVTN